MILPQEADTLTLAARLAKKTKPGTVFCLYGDLGAGKTTFVRGFLKELGHQGAVPSPTFALVNEYPRLKPPIYHMDLYRIENSDLSNLALEEYFDDRDAVTLVEWPEAAEALLPKKRIEIRLDHRKAGGRIVRVKGMTV
ncbi:MAG: tRNA (adenosine(37)-N6)-threonylcarbamoyltransferase complex ATPase subunit type 1 TsaE [Elusimicrobia bacterium]|nr:MAG: tRNA (adenosine(37)-N6)-threonylcarbamoyltransferase complex ATPase subunit type 1 TsaE [Elusimicrobiota bacterium]